MIRFIRSAVIVCVATLFIIGCKDKLIPATSESPSTETAPPDASLSTDPFTAPAPEKNGAVSLEKEPIPPPETEKTPVIPPTTETRPVDPWAQAKTDPTPVPTSFAEPLKPVEPEPPTPPAPEPIVESEPPTPPAPEPIVESEPPTPPAVPEPPSSDPFLMLTPPEAESSEKEPFVKEPVKAVSGNPLRTEPNVSKETAPVAPEPTVPVVAAMENETVPEMVTETVETPSLPESLSQPPSSQPEPAKTEPVKVKSGDPLSELFVDWPKPKLLLVFTGFMNGYVEPCGCAGIEQMKGGLSRRHTFFKAVEKKGWPMLPIDAGNLNKGFGSQEELKFSFVIDEAYRRMKYAAVGIGNRELLFPTDVLILYSVDSPGNRQRYTSANVAILEFNPEFTAPYRIFEEGGVKVGVVSVVAPSLLKSINNQDIVHEDPVKRLKALLPQFAEEKCDKRVLLVHGNTPEIEKIVKAVPGQFDFVVPGDTPAEPPFRPRWIGDSLMIDVGEKGKFAVALGVYDDPDTPFRYERVPLDARFENSPAVVLLMQRYQDELAKKGLAGLGIKPIPDRRAEENGKFVGSKACADCHEPSYSAWKKSRHAKAWHSLVETSKPARTHDPECIACHVVGWNPTEFLPYENGFQGEKETPELLDVGCESCHGPGEMHVKAEQGSDETLQKKLRSAVRLPLEGGAARKNCITCHDGDNSPNFDFDTYWPKIVHVESEE